MTLSHKSDDVEGVETAVGPDRPMSPESPHHDAYNQSTSYMSEQSKPRKKTVRDVFRLGLFLSKKNKKKSLSPDAGPATEEPPSFPAPSRRPMVQRRQSRLDMNEPIEDIFSEVKFETIDKIHEDSCDVAECDSDVIEDPDDVVMQSLMEKEANLPDGQHRDLVDFNDVRGGNVTQTSTAHELGHWDDLT
uniref:Uncharacterized protein n=1 Tax=Ciona savignyi TaxID=51511 RepID=H2YCZ3_CIOSA